MRKGRLDNTSKLAVAAILLVVACTQLPLPISLLFLAGFAYMANQYKPGATEKSSFQKEAERMMGPNERIRITHALVALNQQASWATMDGMLSPQDGMLSPQTQLSPTWERAFILQALASTKPSTSSERLRRQGRANRTIILNVLETLAAHADDHINPAASQLAQTIKWAFHNRATARTDPQDHLFFADQILTIIKDHEAMRTHPEKLNLDNFDSSRRGVITATLTETNIDAIQPSPRGLKGFVAEVRALSQDRSDTTDSRIALRKVTLQLVLRLKVLQHNGSTNVATMIASLERSLSQEIIVNPLPQRQARPMAGAAASGGEVVTNVPKHTQPSSPSPADTIELTEPGTWTQTTATASTEGLAQARSSASSDWAQRQQELQISAMIHRYCSTGDDIPRTTTTDIEFIIGFLTEAAKQEKTQEQETASALAKSPERTVPPTQVEPIAAIYVVLTARKTLMDNLSGKSAKTTSTDACNTTFTVLAKAMNRARGAIFAPLFTINHLKLMKHALRVLGKKDAAAKINRLGTTRPSWRGEKRPKKNQKGFLERLGEFCTNNTDDPIAQEHKAITALIEAANPESDRSARRATGPTK